MKLPRATLAILAFLSACSGGKGGHTPRKEAVENYLKISVNDAIVTCLEKNLKFTSEKPDDLREFAIKIGNASVACDANKSDVKQYVEMIMAFHGVKS